MDMDKRYIEDLARLRARTPKKWGRLAQCGFVALAVGALLVMTNHIYGIGIGGAGCVAVGFAIIKQDKAHKKATQDFMDYYNRNGKLPPYPEDIK
jgi:hypothetical protein